MKKSTKQNQKLATSTTHRELRALRDDQLRACTGGWDIPAGTASPSA